MKKIALIFLSLFLFVLFILPWLIPVNTDKNQVIDSLPWPESKFIDLYGNKIHYRQFEPDTVQKISKKILLVHGFAGSTYVFRKLIPLLQKEGYSITAMDLPAYGYSERNITLNQIPDDILAVLLMRTIDGNKKEYSPWVLCGHSMGASVVYDIAAHYRTICARLIMIDGVDLLRPGMAGSGGFITNSFFRRWINVLAEYYFFKPATIEKLLSSAYARTADEEAVQGYLLPLKIPGTANAIVAKFKTNPALDSARISEYLPTTLIWGENDSWIPLSLGQKFKNKYPFAELTIIPDAGHCPMETHPEETMQAMRTKE